MASQVQVSNRQRKVKLETKELAASASRLFDAVLENLKLRPVTFLSKQQLHRLSRSAILSVVLVSNKEIQKLNKKWRQRDYATDVISFTLALDEEVAGVPFETGELIISAEKAREQAEEYGHSLERELAFLFVHGCLHVLGFDHETLQDERTMFGRQKEILAACGYTA
jgi:probable rRNA maturation factor